MTWSNHNAQTQSQLADLLAQLIHQRGDVVAWACGPGGAVLVNYYEPGRLDVGKGDAHLVEGVVSATELSKLIWEEFFPKDPGEHHPMTVGFPEPDHSEPGTTNQDLLAMVIGPENIVAVILHRYDPS